MLGVIHMRAGRLEPAIEHLSEAAEREPYRAGYHVNLGMALLSAGRRAEARARFEQAMSLNPRIPGAYLGLGDDRLLGGAVEEALDFYSRALELQPGWHEALRRLAWVRATDELPAHRNGGEAVQYAQQACRATGNRHAESLDALGAALAESGAYGDAIVAARAAVDLAEGEGRAALASKIRRRLASYETGKPFRGRASLPR